MSVQDSASNLAPKGTLFQSSCWISLGFIVLLGGLDYYKLLHEVQGFEWP